ncbi:MAG: hypothetical protein IT376_12335 [Polyangiaceae bacterium]|nr:hypothetical protein [Polyangiaceae bacterium]
MSRPRSRSGSRGPTHAVPPLALLAAAVVAACSESDVVLGTIVRADASTATGGRGGAAGGAGSGAGGADASIGGAGAGGAGAGGAGAGGAGGAGAGGAGAGGAGAGGAGAGGAGAGGGQSCFTDAECGPAAFCDPTVCAGPGHCVPRPATCGAERAPVCGCSGHNYWNDCLRRSVGDGKVADGACTPTALPCGTIPFPCQVSGAVCLVESGLECSLGVGRCWVLPCGAGGPRVRECDQATGCLDPCGAGTAEPFVVDETCP